MMKLTKKKRELESEIPIYYFHEKKVGQKLLDGFLQIMWALGLLITFILLISKLLMPSMLQATRYEYLLIALVVFLVIPYLGKLEAFGVKVEIRKRMDEIESRLKALPDYLLGSEYCDEQDFQLAKDCFHRSLSIDPTFWPALLNLGYIAHEEKVFEDAFRLYKKVLEIDPENIYALNNLADAYLYSPPPFRNPEKALSCAETILSICEGMGSALLYKAEALNRLKRPDEAIIILQQILDNNLIPKQKHWVKYELALAKSKRGEIIDRNLLDRIYKIALDNGEGEYFLEMAKEEAELFNEPDRVQIIKFVEEKSN